MTKPEKTEAGAKVRRTGPLLRRLLLALAAPALVLGALEGALRLAGYGTPTELFIAEGPSGSYRTNPDFTAPFIPAAFGIQPLPFRIAKRKPAGTLRVFVVGESAAQGIPEPDFGFAARLRADLRAQFPERSVELYNLGITAIDSHVVLRAVRQAAAFEPDLFVVYMGNNEVVGPYGPGCAYLPAAPPLALIRASVWVRGTRTGQLLSALLARLSRPGAQSREWKGMETFAESSVRGGDPRLEAVYANFSRNLRDLLAAARRSGARVVLSTVVANLRDNAPFISRHRPDLSPEEEKAWTAAYQAGVVASDLDDPATALANFREAARIDPQFAEVAFRMADLAESAGDAASARRGYLDALQWDALRFRPDTRINEIIRAAAGTAGDGVLLVDAAGELGAAPESAAPCPGRALFLDHVHFTWEGNGRMARLLDAACLRQLAPPGTPVPAALDPGAAAAALGYTPDIRLKTLRTMVELRLRPPFTGQFTFSEDQATLRREVGRTEAALSAEGARASARAAVEEAFRRDPQNPALAAHLAELEAEAGHPGAASEAMAQAASLEPGSAGLTVARARLLARDPATARAAEDLLGAAMDEDPAYFSPGTALVELWASRGEFEEGRRVLSSALARHPANPYLRLEYATLLARSGDAAGAEREARAIWEADPGSRPAMAALELRVRLCERGGRPEAADSLTLEAAPSQPDDYFNNERLVRIYGARRDPAKVAESLRAVAASGPFDSAQHVDLAHRFADLGRTLDMLNELARARAVAQAEENDGELRTIGGLVDAYRDRFRQGPPPAGP
jgi:Tfp pilus assembly protein PilF